MPKRRRLRCQTSLISEFVFCKRAATDVLWIMSIPFNSTPSTSVTGTDRLQTVKPRGLFPADCQVGALLPNPLFSSAQRTHHSLLDALSTGLVVVVPLDVVNEVVRAFALPLAR